MGMGRDGEGRGSMRCVRACACLPARQVRPTPPPAYLTRYQQATAQANRSSMQRQSAHKQSAKSGAFMTQREK